MNVLGIIAEYNPFHNGHLYHLSKAKEMTSADLTIAVVSGNYAQHGDLSVLNKFEKTEEALKNGVDLVVELPFIASVQSAYAFADTAVSILNRLHCSDLVFGSETNNLDELKKFAEFNIDITKLKEIMSEGYSYPKAYGLLAGELYPNDILAIAYLRALKGTDIRPHALQRTNDFNSTKIEHIASATAIRKALSEGKDVSLSTTSKINEPVFLKDLYPYIRNILLTRSKEELSEVFLMDEGIENLFIANALKTTDFEEFIRLSISKRYTRARIQRTLIHLVTNTTKKEAKACEKGYIRILGFNKKGREYLASIKKEEGLKLITQFSKLPPAANHIEWKASVIYASLLKDPNAYLKKEVKGPIIL